MLAGASTLRVMLGAAPSGKSEHRGRCVSPVIWRRLQLFVRAQQRAAWSRHRVGVDVSSVLGFVAVGLNGQSCGVNRIDRLYALVEELRAVAPQWRSAQWFAERFEVSSRTIERDLGALQQAGVPIYATPGRRGGYAIDVKHTLPPLNLSAAEVVAVSTALAANSGSPFTHAGRTALQKILAVLAEVDAEGMRELASRVRLFEHADGQGRPSAVLEQAIVGQRVLDITYQDKTGEFTTRAVEPVAVLGVRPHWYLWGWCRLRQGPRSFRLDRITDAVMSDERVPDRGLDPATLELRELVGRGILGN